MKHQSSGHAVLADIVVWGRGITTIFGHVSFNTREVATDTVNSLLGVHMGV